MPNFENFNTAEAKSVEPQLDDIPRDFAANDPHFEQPDNFSDTPETVPDELHQPAANDPEYEQSENLSETPESNEADGENPEDASEDTPEPSEVETSPEAAAKNAETASEMSGEEYESTYREQREAWKHAKAEYTSAKATYEERLAEHYKNYSDKSVFGRGTQKLSEWWRGQPEDIVELENEFKAARSTYAEGLQNVLTARGESREDNADFDATAEKSRTAFAEKFILKPKQDQVAIEKANLHSSETLERTQKVMQTLKKHKWAFRAGSVALTGAIVGSGAGLFAGIAAGGMKAGRMGLGILGGMGGAALGERSGRKGVAEAEANLAETKEATVEQFSVKDIDRLETALTNAENTLDSKERARKFKTIAGAIIGGGGLAGMIGSAQADVIDDSRFYGSDSKLADQSVNETASSQSAVEVASSEQTTEETTVPESSEPSEDVPEKKEDTEVFGEAAFEWLNNPEKPSTPEDVPVSNYDVEDNDRLWNITKDSYASQLKGLSETQQNQVLDAVFDHLRDNPELSKELGVENVDLIYENDILKMSAIADLVEKEVERVSASSAEVAGAAAEAAVDSTPSPEGAMEATVKGGDTLWALTKSAYGAQLESLSTQQQNQVLFSVFKAIEDDETLIEQLGVKSGDIDLIRPGEVMKLDALSELIDEKVAKISGIDAASISAQPAADVAENAETASNETTTEAPSEEPPAPAETHQPTPEQINDAVKELGLPEAQTERILEKFGSTENFETQKQLNFNKILDGQIEADTTLAFEAIKTINIQSELLKIETLAPANAEAILKNNNIDANPQNLYDLMTLHSFFKDFATAEGLAQLNIDPDTNPTIDQVFAEYVLQNSAETPSETVGSTSEATVSETAQAEADPSATKAEAVADTEATSEPDQTAPEAPAPAEETPADASAPDSEVSPDAAVEHDGSLSGRLESAGIKLAGNYQIGIIKKFGSVEDFLEQNKDEVEKILGPIEGLEERYGENTDRITTKIQTINLNNLANKALAGVESADGIDTAGASTEGTADIAGETAESEQSSAETTEALATEQEIANSAEALGVSEAEVQKLVEYYNKSHDTFTQAQTIVFEDALGSGAGPDHPLYEHLKSKTMGEILEMPFFADPRGLTEQSTLDMLESSNLPDTPANRVLLANWRGYCQDNVFKGISDREVPLNDTFGEVFTDHFPRKVGWIVEDSPHETESKLPPELEERVMEKFDESLETFEKTQREFLGEIIGKDPDTPLAEGESFTPVLDTLKYGTLADMEGKVLNLTDTEPLSDRNITQYLTDNKLEISEENINEIKGLKSFLSEYLQPDNLREKGIDTRNGEMSLDELLAEHVLRESK